MSDPFAKVTPGQRLAALPAEAWNAFIDAAQAHRRNLAANPGDGLVMPNDGQIVRVKNTTASELPRFSVLGLEEPIFAPDAATPATLNEITFKGVKPTIAAHAGGRVAITLAPIAAGEIGLAQIDGVCLCKVAGDKDAAEVRFADVVEDTTANLAIADTGLQVLWIASGSGSRWALVRLGGGGGGGGDASACYHVNAIDNDFLICAAWNGTEPTGPTVNIAKPWELRHDASLFVDIDSLTTTDEQTVEVVTIDEIEATWKVSPAYKTGTLIQAAPRMTGMSVDDEELTLMDLNHAGRVWCEVQPEPGE